MAATAGGHEGAASVELSFGRDEEGLYGINGHVSACVELTCQRCLGPLRQTLDADVALGVITAEEQAINLPERYEPLLVQEERISLAELVEDELLLTLPVIPRHEEETCEAAPAPELEPAPEEHQQPNPFAVLAQLKKRDEPE